MPHTSSTTRPRHGHRRGLDDAAGAARRGVDCAGFAPDASLYVLRVFTSKQASATDWFLEAFNHALHRRVHLINLAVGGPDYRDTPFVDKVSQLAAAGITIVSGAGNSGPGWGSLMNPADDAAVIGVAGLDKDGKLAAWSSRGMTLWEEPLGAGRAGVDVITHGEFWGADQHNACQHQWGTSVACPVVVGLLTLLLSSLPERQRNTLLNPAALKQLVYAGSSPLPDYGWLEQGAGLLDAPATEAAARAFEPHASAVPSVLDLRPSVGCPYLWPLCDMPLYATMQPLFVNLTLLNSRSATAAFAAPPLWRPRAGGHALHVSFAYDDHRGLSAHRGFLGVRLSVSSSASGWAGEVEGELVITLVDTALAANGSAAAARPAGSPHRVVVPLRATVVPTPPRRKRLLFDTLHSSAYPNGFFPNDDLSQLSVELMDWNGDSPHTNYVPLYASLRASGFYVETLRADLTSFDASLYGALLLLDPEEPFLPSEPAKLRADVTSRGLGLVVAADWHAPDLMASLDYTDEATKQRRVCGAGGANVPALNELLEPLGIGFGSQVYSGTYHLGGGAVAHFSGSSLRRFPAGGRLVSATLSRGVKRGDRWLGGEKGGREERALLARRARLSDASMTRPRHVPFRCPSSGCTRSRTGMGGSRPSPTPPALTTPSRRAPRRAPPAAARRSSRYSARCSSRPQEGSRPRRRRRGSAARLTARLTAPPPPPPAPATRPAPLSSTSTRRAARTGRRRCSRACRGCSRPTSTRRFPRGAGCRGGARGGAAHTASRQ